MKWSPDDMPSLEGRTAVVTGANSGIGWYTAVELGKHGAAVTLARRNLELGEQAAAKMRDAGAGDIRVAELDLSSLASVEQFAARWRGPLDLLVNNAGVMTPPRYRETADGFELQFGTNHLGHYALTGRLLPALLKSTEPRVVTIASIAHFRGKADLLDGSPRSATDRSRRTATPSWPTFCSPSNCSVGRLSTAWRSLPPRPTRGCRRRIWSPRPRAWAPFPGSGCWPHRS